MTVRDDLRLPIGAFTVALRSVGVPLAGRGVDGAVELRRLRDGGALTVARSAEGCIVQGLRGGAIRLGGAVHVIPPGAIALLPRDSGRRLPQSPAVPA